MKRRCSTSIISPRRFRLPLAGAISACRWSSRTRRRFQGTLGALYPEREILAAADLILLVNGDTLCRWPWKAMIRRHLRSGADATLLLHRRAPVEDFGGGVGIDSHGAVVQLRDGDPIGEVAKRQVFAGAQVLSAHRSGSREDLQTSSALSINPCWRRVEKSRVLLPSASGTISAAHSVILPLPSTGSADPCFAVTGSGIPEGAAGSRLSPPSEKMRRSTTR